MKFLPLAKADSDLPMAAKPKITLALDQATRVSGWALFRDDVLIECGHWAHTATEIPVRIHNLC